ncbi:hypothetical protein Leryth_022904 [Lithospermum erythrorhizon]|uniref:Reticulon-like protein n=1 Tax=Lithospermum erythrorhizon TaxID=34254 RepID=A0AAV3QZZ8_LITER|nr:hypothetical protein Leryth_022904 [Lithospermum erythrorhizon]
MASSFSDSDNVHAPRARLFGRERPIHAALGGGKFADVLLWRDRRTSAAIMVAVAVVWFLFEVVEYSFISLVCHLFITTMLLIFIWSTMADFFHWTPPNIPQLVLRDSTFTQVAITIHDKLNKFLGTLFYIACGEEPRFFLLAIASLFMLSLIGNYISTVNLLFLGLICMETLPLLYEIYEEEVDELANKITWRMRRKYREFEASILRKVPRGTSKYE